MIISIAGFISSGKDTIADYLIKEHGFRKESFAGALKDAVCQIFGWERELLDGLTQESREWRNQVDQWWAKRLDMPYLTPRWVLQYWGTEVIRNNFHDDMWIAAVERRIMNNPGDIVITDCRFPNEFKCLKNAGGSMIRVFRGPLPEWYPFAESHMRTNDATALMKLRELGVHASEYSSVGLPYDHIIHNDGSLIQLYQNVETILQTR